MSEETLSWLNTNTLIGMTDQRGKAWHWRAEEQDGKTNHYPGAIPVEDVRRRLFDWHAVSRAVAVEQPCEDSDSTHVSEEGLPVRWQPIVGRQAICRSDSDLVMGVFSENYQPHQYDQWLVNNVATLLDDDLVISSAGLLRGGAIAWVEVSMPETITTPDGIDFRPNLLATTSFDGSIATTYKRTVTATVCDNTRAVALSEQGQEFKVRHSRRSLGQLGAAREALAMVYSAADEFAAQAALLCSTPVSEGQWQEFLDLHVPRRDELGRRLEGRALKVADRKRDILVELYQADPRVSQWAGTAYGVVQAVNTFDQHIAPVRGGSRADRVALRAVTDDLARSDVEAWRSLQSVLTPAA